MANLTEVLKVRLDRETKVELTKRAAKVQRSPSDLARLYIRSGLERKVTRG